MRSAVRKRRTILLSLPQRRVGIGISSVSSRRLMIEDSSTTQQYPVVCWLPTPTDSLSLAAARALSSSLASWVEKELPESLLLSGELNLLRNDSSEHSATATSSKSKRFPSYAIRAWRMRRLRRLLVKLEYLS